MKKVNVSLFMLVVAAGCTAGTDPIAGSGDELSLVECRRDVDCARGEVCLDTDYGAYCSNGERCTSSRECALGSVCRTDHCISLERESREERTRPSDEAACPRGSRPGRVACPPGLEAVLVSRDPSCSTCELTRDTFDLCEVSAMDPERCRRLLRGSDDGENIVRRCRAAGYSAERCRALLEDDELTTAERCRAAGISPERCRYLMTGEDEPSFADRCRAAGISPERCRDLIAGESDDVTFEERCRAAGLTLERCRALRAD